MVELEGIILHIGSFLVIAGIYAIINVGLERPLWTHGSIQHRYCGVFCAGGVYGIDIGDAAAES